MAVGTALASAKAGEKIFADLYSVAKGQVKNKFKRWQTVSKINTIYRKLFTVRKVKTIWQFEREVDLMTFYYPSRVMIPDGRKEIRSAEDFGYDGNIVIEGTVGQGKSIFLRHLCAHELYVGKIIPLFVELRRLEPGKTFIDHLCEHLDALGLSGDRDIFDFLAASGKIVLCLDGFDEVSETERASLIRQIERVATKYETLKILVTSRPDTGIDKSPLFRVFKLAPLARPEVRQIIDKLTNNATLTDEIVTAVNKSKSNIKEMLTTPLMVTLLVIAYKAHQKVPETLAEFYETLFNTLLLRHDKLKPGFIRARRCGLHDRAIREVFDATSFLCRKQQLTTIPHDQLYEMAKEATKISQVSCEPQLFIDDVKQITCLLLEEGGKYHFIHKSVSEYHSASFIRRRPEEAAASFYRRVLEGGHGRWSQELEFLSQIDRFRFCKYFLIDDLVRLSGMTQDALREHSHTAFFTVLMEFVSSLMVGVDATGSVRSITFKGDVRQSRWSLDQHLNTFWDVLVRADWRPTAEKIQGISKVPERFADLKLVDKWIGLDAVIKSTLVEPRGRMLQACSRISQELWQTFVDSIAFVKNMEASAAVFDGMEV